MPRCIRPVPVQHGPTVRNSSQSRVKYVAPSTNGVTRLPVAQAADCPASMGFRAAAQRAHSAASAANDPATAQGITDAFHDAELCVGAHDAA
jgi:hypothetical protein